MYYFSYKDEQMGSFLRGKGELMAAQTGASAHGFDPGDLFAGAFRLLYALAEAIGGAYRRQSEHTALLAEILTGGLAGKHVLDIGCGFGITTWSVARYNPNSITAIDPSKGMLEMAEFVLSDQANVRSWVEYNDPDELIKGTRYIQLTEYLNYLRVGFQETRFFFHARPSFYRLGLMDSPPAWTDLYGAAVGNNSFHWVVNRIRTFNPELSVEQAIVVGLRGARKLLKSDGVLVLQEPKQFVVDDVDPDREAFLASMNDRCHPAFLALNGAINSILIKHYGIERPTPTNPGMFLLSTLPGLAEQAGLRLERVVQVEDPAPVRALDFFEAIIPINLGGVDLPLETKVTIVRDAGAMLRRQPMPAEFNRPLHGQSFYFAFRAA